MPRPPVTFDAAKTLYLGRGIIQLKRSLPTGATATTDTITTLTPHGLGVGAVVQFVAGTDFATLVAGNYYHVVNVGSTTTFKVAATPGGEAINVGTATAGVFRASLGFAAKKIDDEPTIEMKPLDFPDEQGVLREARTVLGKAAESWTFDLLETRRLLELFDGAMSGSRSDLPCTLWLPDPSDAAGATALVSDADFPCTVLRDQSMSHGNSEYSQTSIRIRSNKQGPVKWTANAI